MPNGSLASRAKSLVHGTIKNVFPPPVYWHFLAWRLGSFDPEIELLDRLCDEDKVSVDVGASNGSYTAHLLTHSRRCVAFEARPDAAQAIGRTLTRVPHDRLQVEAVALSDRVGEMLLKVLPDDTGRSTLEAQNHIEKLGAVREIAVPVRTLDDYGDLGPVGFIKIDVEGHEEAVLRGGQSLLERDMPAILVEVEERHNPGSIGRVTGWLANLGYAGYFYRDGRLKPIGEFDAAVHQDERNIVGNVNRELRYVNNFVFLGPASQVRLADLVAAPH